MFAFDPALENGWNSLHGELVPEERAFAESRIVQFRQLLSVWSLERQLRPTWQESFADRVQLIMRECSKKEPEQRSYLLRSVVLGRFILDMMVELEKCCAGGLVGLFGEEICQMSVFQHKYEALFAPFCKGESGTASMRPEDWVLLQHFALAMQVAIKYLVGTRLHKTLLIAACAAVEGRKTPRRYIAGSRQSRETSWRHALYVAISGCTPVRRRSPSQMPARASVAEVVLHKEVKPEKAAVRPVLVSVKRGRPMKNDLITDSVVARRLASRRHYRRNAKLRKERAKDSWRLRLQQQLLLGQPVISATSFASATSFVPTLLAPIAEGDNESETTGEDDALEEEGEEDGKRAAMDLEGSNFVLDLENAKWLEDEDLLEGLGGGEADDDVDMWVQPFSRVLSERLAWEFGGADFALMGDSSLFV